MRFADLMVQRTRAALAGQHDRELERPPCEMLAERYYRMYVVPEITRAAREGRWSCVPDKLLEGEDVRAIVIGRLRADGFDVTSTLYSLAHSSATKYSLSITWLPTTTT